MSEGFYKLGYALGQRNNQKKFEGLQGQLEQSKQDISNTKNQESDLRKGLEIANSSDDYNMTGKEVYGKQLSDIQSQAQTQQNRPYDILQKMAQLNPEATQRYLQIEEYKQVQMAQEQEKQMQLQKQQMSRASQMAGTILRLPETDRKEAYQFYLNKAQQEGLDVSDMPEQFNSEAEYRLMDLQDKSRANEDIYKGMLDEKKQSDVVNQQNISNQGTVWEREKFGREQALTREQNLLKSKQDASKPMSPDAAKTFAIAKFGVKALDNMDKLLQTNNYKVGTGTIIAKAFQGEESQKFNLYKNDLQDMVGRLRSGGAINEEEVKSFKKLLPDVYDKPEVVKEKILRTKEYLSEIGQRITGDNSVNTTNEKPNITRLKFNPQTGEIE
jgi:hypothetical protein